MISRNNVCIWGTFLLRCTINCTCDSPVLHNICPWNWPHIRYWCFRIVTGMLARAFTCTDVRLSTGSTVPGTVPYLDFHPSDGIERIKSAVYNVQYTVRAHSGCPTRTWYKGATIYQVFLTSILAGTNTPFPACPITRASLTTVQSCSS